MHDQTCTPRFGRRILTPSGTLARIAAALAVRLVFVVAVVGSCETFHVFAAGGGSPSLDGLPAPSAALSRAVALTNQAAEAGAAEQRDRRLDEARQTLEVFLKAEPTHADAPRALIQLGIVHTARGQGLWQAAQRATDDAARKDTAAQSRDAFRQAESSFSEALDRLRTLVDGFPKFIEPGDPAIGRREALKAQLLQALMYHAGVVEELAGTFAPESPESRDHFQAAADRYERIYKDYRTLLAGLMARLKQGQCYHRLGNTRRALGLYNDVLTQPSDLEALRRLRVTAMYLSLEGWTGEHEKMYELAFSQGEEYLTHLRPEERAWPEWQAVRFYTAQGYRLAADGLPAGRGAERDQWRGKSLEHVDRLVSEAGPYQEAARQLASAWREADRGGR